MHVIGITSVGIQFILVVVIVEGLMNLGPRTAIADRDRRVENQPQG